MDLFVDVETLREGHMLDVETDDPYVVFSPEAQCNSKTLLPGDDLGLFELSLMVVPIGTEEESCQPSEPSHCS